MTTSTVDLRKLLWYGTSTIGLITSMDGDRVNVMAAEWTYMVARRPPHFAIGCKVANHSTDLIRARGEFGLTLCDASMAGLAEFVGNFSGAEVDKTQASAIRMRDPVATATPTVLGGPLSAECRVVRVVDLPEYALIIGEALWLTVDDVANDDPLVKHGGMYRLGAEIRSMAIHASLAECEHDHLRVCATAQGVDEEQPWSVTLASTSRLLHTEIAGDCLDVCMQPPDDAAPGDHLVVARPDCPPVRVPLTSAGRLRIS
jgi:flavin reductase (DIM6/NTAB) family NADH-FMN oxidoreductase RutF